MTNTLLLLEVLSRDGRKKQFPLFSPKFNSRSSQITWCLNTMFSDNKVHIFQLSLGVWWIFVVRLLCWRSILERGTYNLYRILVAKARIKAKWNQFADHTSLYEICISLLQLLLMEHKLLLYLVYQKKSSVEGRCSFILT